MARIRSIKPEFFTSLTIADLSLSARLTFIGLWTYVDDNGVGLDDARLIRAAVWPLEEAPDILQRTREDLQSLHEAFLVTRYRVSGKALLAVTNWSEHQKVSHPRKPRFPGPDQADFLEPTPSDLRSCGIPEHSGNPPETFQSPPETFRPEQGAGSREQGAGKGSENAPDGASIPGQTCVLDAATEASREDPPREDVERVCQHLADRLVDTGSKRPAITKAWRESTRLLLDRDGVTVDQALKAIDWALADSFWHAHILTPKKLREKYETLRRQASTPVSTRAPHVPFTNPADPSAYYGEL